MSIIITKRIIKGTRVALEQMLPAYTVDFLMRMIGKKPMFIKLQNKISKSINALEYFTCRSWHFTNENLITLTKAVNTNDSQVGIEINF